jgi:hypothetical protein
VKATREKVRQPRQAALIEDARIAELDKIGYRYAEIRDARIELNRQESALKLLAIKAMHKHGKTVYRHGTIDIALLLGEEDIKVKIRPEAEVKSHGEAAPDNPSEQEAEGAENIGDQEQIEDGAGE